METISWERYITDVLEARRGGLRTGEYLERIRIIKLLEQQDHTSWLGMNQAAIELIQATWLKKVE